MSSAALGREEPVSPQLHQCIAIHTPLPTRPFSPPTASQEPATPKAKSSGEGRLIAAAAPTTTAHSIRTAILSAVDTFTHHHFHDDASQVVSLMLEQVQKILDQIRALGHNLTMFKTEPTTAKGEQTRELIFETALELFREKGFDQTTMQDIAAHAQVAKSAAYYYFPGKEAIIQAYYEAVQSEQERLCNELFAETTDLKKRLHAAMHSKFDLAQDDRKLLGIVFRYTGEPTHPLSCLGSGTADIRSRATAIFKAALSVDRLPKDLERLLPLALWSLQMGLLVMFLYDNSPGQKRTRQLATGSIDLTVKMIALAKLPLLKPVRTKILKLLSDAGLISG